MKNKILQRISYAFYLTSHPIKGFWGLKNENIGDVKIATVFLFFLTFVTVLSKQYTAYLFRSVPVQEVNLLQEVSIVLLLFMGWCVANWCLTTLFEGEGRFRDIYIATAYALVPYSVVTLFMIPLSYMFTMDEMSLYNGIGYLVLFWTAVLIICSVLVTHQYTLSKSLLMIVCIILCMCMFAFIILLFFNLIQQITGFITNLEHEISLRMT